MRKLSNSLLFLVFSLLLLQAGCFEGCSGIDVTDLPLDESYIIDYGNMAKSDEINAATKAYAYLRKSFYSQSDVYDDDLQTMEQLVTELGGFGAIGNNAASSLQDVLDNNLNSSIKDAASSSEKAKDFAELVKTKLIEQKYRGDHDPQTDISSFLAANCLGVAPAQQNRCRNTLTKLSNFIDDFYTKSVILANKLAQDEMLIDLIEADRKIAELKGKIGTEIMPTDIDASDFEFAILEYDNDSHTLKKYIEQMPTVKIVAAFMRESALKLLANTNKIKTLIDDPAKFSSASSLPDEAVQELNELIAKANQYPTIEALKKDSNKEISTRLNLAFASGNDFATEKEVSISSKNKTDLNNVLDELALMDNGILFLNVPQKGSADEFVKSLAVAIVNFQSDLSGNKIDNIYGLNKTRLFEVADSYGMDFEQRKLFLQKQAQNAVELKSDNGKYKNIFVVNAADYASLEETSAIVNSLKDKSRVLVVSKNSSPSDDLDASLASDASVFRLTGLKGNEAQLISKKLAEDLNASRTNKLSVQIISDTLAKIVASGFVKKGVGLAQTENVVRQVFAKIPTSVKPTAQELKDAVLNAVDVNLGVSKLAVKSSGVLAQSVATVLRNVKSDEEHYTDRALSGTGGSGNTALGLAQLKAAEEIKKSLASASENKKVKDYTENIFNLYQDGINSKLKMLEEKSKKLNDQLLAKENEIFADKAEISELKLEIKPQQESINQQIKIYKTALLIAEKYREMLDTVYAGNDPIKVNEYLENNKGTQGSAAEAIVQMKQKLKDRELDELPEDEEDTPSNRVMTLYVGLSFKDDLYEVNDYFIDTNLTDPIFNNNKVLIKKIANEINTLDGSLSKMVLSADIK